MTDRFVISGGTVQTNVGMVMLTPTWAAILGTLKKRQPDIVPFGDLAVAVWGVPELWPNDWKNNLKVHISHVRTALNEGEAAIKITNHYAFGYALWGKLDVID